MSENNDPKLCQIHVGLLTLARIFVNSVANPVRQYDQNENKQKVRYHSCQKNCTITNVQNGWAHIQFRHGVSFFLYLIFF